MSSEESSVESNVAANYVSSEEGSVENNVAANCVSSNKALSNIKNF